MTTDLQNRLLEIITTSDFDRKITLAGSLPDLKIETIPKLDDNQTVLLASPGRPEGFRVVPPRKVPRRSILNASNRAPFLHAIANIELLAIELPALGLLRYGSNDREFIAVQCEVIAEEAKHFDLLRNRLAELKCPFGSLAVHHGLWDWAWKCSSELEHQIIIPCYLEARGLDVTPNFVRELMEAGDRTSSEILQIILDEEVGHVKRGIEYLESKALLKNISADTLFENTLRNFFGDRLKSKVPVNFKNRELAGFSPRQIQLIS